MADRPPLALPPAAAAGDGSRRASEPLSSIAEFGAAAFFLAQKSVGERFRSAPSWTSGAATPTTWLACCCLPGYLAVAGWLDATGWQ